MRRKRRANLGGAPAFPDYVRDDRNDALIRGNKTEVQDGTLHD